MIANSRIDTPNHQPAIPSAPSLGPPGVGMPPTLPPPHPPPQPPSSPASVSLRPQYVQSECKQRWFFVDKCLFFLAPNLLSCLLSDVLCGVCELKCAQWCVCVVEWSFLEGAVTIVGHRVVLLINLKGKCL